ncbi:hypothetical protein [Actinokineospora pegani]|uniref:hypothetical protein n=1 Tax=Actinokineospora pegani TaxID=2654637 RepID=UPI0012EAFD9D|nr:hypothetical protein [Actinokineospora pegani]
MNRDVSAFDEAFTRFVEATGRWRDTSPDALLERWLTFVAECEQGYSRDAQDYFNDLTTRDALERASTAPELHVFPELARLRTRVEKADSRFRVLLVPDVFPCIPKECWWSRGIVKGGARSFVEDMRREYRLELVEVERSDTGEGDVD